MKEKVNIWSLRVILVPLLQENFVPSLSTSKKSEREALEFPEFILGACSHDAHGVLTDQF